MFRALLDLFQRTPPATTGTQRRNDRRFTCSVPVRLGSGEGAMITELAQHGLRLQVQKPLRRGRALMLRFAGQAAAPLLHTEVVWCRNHGNFSEIGVRCLGSENDISLSWVTPLLRSISRTSRWVEDRHTVRFATRVSAAMRRTDSDVASFVEGHLSNVSRTGAAFCGSVTAQIGAPVAIRISPLGMESVLVKGRVVRRGRAEDGRSEYGVRFDEGDASVQRVLTALMQDRRAA